MYGVPAGILPDASSWSGGVDVGKYFECGAASFAGEGVEDSVCDVARAVSGGSGGVPAGSGVEAECTSG